MTKFHKSSENLGHIYPIKIFRCYINIYRKHYRGIDLKSIDLKVPFYVCYFLHAPRSLMKRFKRRAVFLAANLETLAMVPFFGSWPLQYKMLSVGPAEDAETRFDISNYDLDRPLLY